MRNVIFHERLSDYRSYIKNEIVTNDLFYKNKFYSGLIDFIIDNRTPIFFHSSQAYEYAHFTQSFNWVLARDVYESRLVEDLYFIHDFVHMLFNYPVNPRDHTLSDYRDIIVTNERIAANETEIFTYYRIPELRKLTFSNTILFDLTSKIYKYQPEISKIYYLRNQIIETENVPQFLNNSEGEKIIKFLKRFKDNNKLWTRIWWSSFPKNSLKYKDDALHLPPFKYERFLKNYKSVITQKEYEENCLKNIILGLEILGIKKKPESFNEIRNFLKYFEGKVFMEKEAKKYHTEYLRAKTKAVKSMTYAVYLGRFSPLHKGHQKVINKVLKMYKPEEVIIMLGSANVINERTPFTFDERKQMFKLLYPQLKIITLPDYNDDKSWLTHIKLLEEKMNAKFTFFGGSEEDLEVVGRTFETKVLVDRNLSKNRVSATLVRKYLRESNLHLVKSLLDKKIYDYVIDLRMAHGQSYF